MGLFRRWAFDRGLRACESPYVARTPDRLPLRFTATGEDAVERSYRTHRVSPELSAAKRERLVERESQPPDLVVIWALKEWSCTVCSGGGELLIMDGPGPLCLNCAHLDHLVFLPSGDAGLTRRAKKASKLSAVVVRFSRTRRRYERQGILVEPEALATADVDGRASAPR
jgi:hypothetical protein